jgi:hypothetical protein
MVMRLKKLLAPTDDAIDDDDLTLDERRLLAMWRTLPEGERDALTRVAQYLAAHPSNGGMTQAEFDELCERAKRLQ